MTARMRITVDGDTLMDADLGNWTQPKPQIDQLNQLAASPTPPAWTRPVMVMLAEAALRKRSLNIDITTRDSGWTMSVDDAEAKT